MHNRKIFSELKTHLLQQQITVLTGMRRVGKTTALYYLLDQIDHNNKVFIDLEKIEHRHIFTLSSYQETQIELEILGIDFSRKAVIALDEIQLVPQITSVIKYFYDHFPIKFLVTGSSSFYMKGRFSESLAGRKRIFEMYPLDFVEFLEFNGKDTHIIRKYAFQSFQRGIYLKFKDDYEEFIRFGGFPEVVIAQSKNDKIAYLKDIINAYIELDIKLLSDFEASYDLYALIRLLAARVASPIELSKLSSILGIKRNKVKQYLQLLEKTYFILTVPPYSRNIDGEIKHRKKIYLSDTGILNILAQVSSGQVFENAIAVQLKHIGELNYYQKISGQEIDFILDTQQAVEVQETPAESDLHKLNRRARQISMEKKALVGRYPPANGFIDFIWGGNIG